MTVTSKEGQVEKADLVTLTIDGIEVSVPKGTLVIRAAEQIGVQIPRFCDHPLLAPVGACRQCLVEVALPGPDGEPRTMMGPPGRVKPQASCTLVASEGMVVNTQVSSPIADKAQQGVMEQLLINHPLDCPVCDKGGECPLQNQAMSNGRPVSRFEDVKRTYPKPINISSQVLLDRERCVLCARCTRFSDQIAGDPFIALVERGALQQVGIYEEKPFESYFSGNTVQICPVGALTGAAYRFRSRPFDLVSTPSVQRRDRSAAGGADPSWPRGLDLAVAGKQTSREIMNLASRGIPLSPAGALVLWIPVLGTPSSPALAIDYTGLAASVVTGLDEALKSDGRGSQFFVAIPESAGASPTAGRETNSCSNTGRAANASLPRFSSTVGTSRQPRTVRFSDAAIRSIPVFCAARASSSRGRNTMPAAYSPTGGSSKSTTARRKASGICVRMPAPSPVPASEPIAPRCSRLRSAVSARSMMLAPPMLKLVPSTPTLVLPARPSGASHWMPNSAALSALTSAIRLSTNTCARRESRRSITARICRYCGSGAVMMSELVAGSAWIWPPVDGWAVACTGAVQRVSVDERGRILSIGIADRVFAAHQRKAIALRDGRCVIPGCRVPSAWSRQISMSSDGRTSSIGTCMTMPVFGWMGRKGE